MPFLSCHLQVAEGSWARHRYAPKFVMLSGDARQLWWDDGKKSVDLTQVIRVSVGLETRTLQKLYSGSNMPTEVSSYHWFSLHTQTRSFDFGATRENGGVDENDTVVLWVLTLQQLIAQRLPPESVGAACCALSNAQYRWQQFDQPNKEWPCPNCTFLNPTGSPQCSACGYHRPQVTLCPCLTPLEPALRGLSNTIGLRAFEDGPEAHLLWFLVQAVESPLPHPFGWAARARPAALSEPYLIMSTDITEGALETAHHPHLLEMRRAADSLRAQLMANGGVPDFSNVPPTPRDGGFSSPEPSSSRDRGSDGSEYDATPRATPPEGLSQREFEEALAYAAALEAPTPRGGEPTVARQGTSFEEVAPNAQNLDAADVFRHCMGGSVQQVKQFLELGGYADTVYKSAYGWEVNPNFLYTKPNDNTSVLNYVATWSDFIGEPAVELVRLLLQHGADLGRDDAQDLWFTPIHNAVANGAHQLVNVMLDHMPDAINLTTGDGRVPLHVLSLCDNEEDREATLDVLLRRRGNASLNFQEPFKGDTALHAAAREGHNEVVIKLLEAGASAATTNEAGRTALGTGS